MGKSYLYELLRFALNFFYRRVFSLYLNHTAQKYSQKGTFLCIRCSLQIFKSFFDIFFGKYILSQITQISQKSQNSQNSQITQINQISQISQITSYRSQEASSIHLSC